MEPREFKAVKPCLTGVAEQPLDPYPALSAQRVKDAEGTAKPLVLDAMG